MRHLFIPVNGLFLPMFYQYKGWSGTINPNFFQIIGLFLVDIQYAQGFKFPICDFIVNGFDVHGGIKNVNPDTLEIETDSRQSSA